MADLETQPYALQPLGYINDKSFEGQAQATQLTEQRVTSAKKRHDSIAQAEWISSDEGRVIGDKWQAFSDSWDDTWAGKGFDYFKYDNGWLETEDEKFMTEWDDKSVMATLSATQLPISYYQRLKDAKNPEHKKSLLRGIMEERNRDEFIGNSLNSYGGVLTERTMSGIATGLIDIDLAIGGAFGIGAKITKAKGIMMSGAVATHAGVSKFIYEIDEDVSAGEAIAFGLIGTLANGFTINKLGKSQKLADDLAGETVHIPKNTDLADIVANQTVKEEVVVARKSAKAQKAQTKIDTEQVTIDKVRAELDARTEKAAKIADPIKREEALKKIKDEGVELDARKTRLNENRLAEKIKQGDSMVVESAFKKFNKTADDIGKQAKKETDLKIKADKEWQSKRMKSIANDVKLMGEDLTERVVEWRQHIRTLQKNMDVEGIKNFDGIIEKLHKAGAISTGVFKKYKNNLANKKFEIPEIKAKLNKDGTYTIQTGKEVAKDTKKTVSKGKLVIGGALAMVLADSVSADDGGITSGGVSSLILGAIVLGVGFKNFGAIKNSVMSTVKRAELLDKTRPMREKLDDLIGQARTALTETYAPLARDSSKPFTDILKKVLWDSENGEFLTVERGKAALYHGFSGYTHKVLDENYLEHLKLNNMSRFEAGMTNLGFGEIGARMDFEIKVMEAIEQGKHLDQPAVQKAAKELRDVHKKIRQQLKDSGVKGADKMLDLGDEYMPRYFRSEQMSVLMNSLDEANLKKFTEEFAQMMGGDIDKARAYINIMTDTSEASKRLTNAKEMEAFLTSKGIANITADEALDALGIGTTRMGRTKARITIDKTKFKEIKLNTLDGGTATVKLNDIFVNNAVEAMDRYLNSVTGNIALADAGFTSIDDILTEIATSGALPKNKKILTDIVESMVGKPMIDISDEAAKVLQTVSNFTVAAKMPFSVISLMQETFNTIVKSRGAVFKTGMSEFKNIVLKHGESSAIVDELSTFMGQGMHRHSASYGSFSHMAESLDNIGSHSKSGFSLHKVTEIGRDTVLYNLGLVPVSDFLTRVNLVDTASYLHDISNGTAKMPAYIKKAIGLTPELESMLKGKLTKVDGNLQKIGLETWKREDQLAFRKLVDNMMQKRIQQATMGGTPHWARSNTLGIAMSQLLKFPLQAFSNHGIFDLKGTIIHKDPRAMASMFAWFSGGYVAAMVRYELQGREYTEDDLILAATLSMPLVGAITSLHQTATGSPAMFSAMDSLSNGMMSTVGSVISNGE